MKRRMLHPIGIGGQRRALADMRNKTGEKKSLFQFIKFCIVGFSNTCFSYGLNILILFLLRHYELSWDYIIANVIAFLLGTLWACFWNTRFVFQLQQQNIREVISVVLKSYVAYGGTGIILNNALSWVWITKIGISRYLAPLINLMICVPVNYFINRFWTFRKSIGEKQK